MRLSAEENLVLGIAFCAVGLVAALLQTWLWTFPMAPDPTGTDPNGVTTAPKFWRVVHRGMGYVFLGIYLVLLLQMVPRIGRYDGDAWNGIAVGHAVLGAGIGAVLGVKILILRRGQRFGKLLPYFGWGLVGLSLLVVGLAGRPISVLQGPASGFTISEAEEMRTKVFRNCTQCHGLSVVVGGGKDGWMETLEEMAENAEDRGLADPSGGDRARMAEFLGHFPAGENDDHGWNRRGRGRDRERREDD